MIHQYNYWLRDLNNQKGGFHVENIHLDILLHVTYLMLFILIYFILLCLVAFPGSSSTLSTLLFLPSFPPYML